MKDMENNSSEGKVYGLNTTWLGSSEGPVRPRVVEADVGAYAQLRWGVFR